MQLCNPLTALKKHHNFHKKISGSAVFNIYVELFHYFTDKIGH